MTTNPRTWRTEFPQFDPADMPPIPDHWEDCSWRNETCPHFIAARVNPHDEAGCLSIWIDPADESEREFQGDESDGARFHVYTCEASGAVGDIILGTNDWGRVLRLVHAFELAEFAAEAATPRDAALIVCNALGIGLPDGGGLVGIGPEAWSLMDKQARASLAREHAAFEGRAMDRLFQGGDPAPEILRLEAARAILYPYGFSDAGGGAGAHYFERATLGGMLVMVGYEGEHPAPDAPVWGIDISGADGSSLLGSPQHPETNHPSGTLPDIARLASDIADTLGDRLMAEHEKEGRIAGAFADILRLSMTPEQFAEMQRRNRANADAGTCASHEFCDANEAMDEAFERVGIATLPDYRERLPLPADPDPLNPLKPQFQAVLMPPAVCDLWGRAWDCAMDAFLTAPDPADQPTAAPMPREPQIADLIGGMDAGEEEAARFLDRLGFSPEIGGGGAWMLTLYYPNGWSVIATHGDGGAGLPSIPDFILAAYPPDWDGSDDSVMRLSDSDGIEFEFAAVKVCRFAMSGGQPESLHLPLNYSAARDGISTFYFTHAPTYPCHPMGSTWNGFDNVKISPDVRAMIVADWLADAGDDDGTMRAQLAEIPAGPDGLIPVADGWATTVDHPTAVPLPDARAIVDTESVAAGRHAFTCPTLADALDIYFPREPRGGDAYYSDSDATQPITRADAESMLADPNRGRVAAFYNEEGDYFRITAERVG